MNKVIIIQTSSRFNILSCFAYGIGSLLLIAAPVLTFYARWDSLAAILEVLFSNVILGFLGLISLRALLWFILGQEIVKIEDGDVVILKKGTFWMTREKRIRLNQIEHIATRENFHERNSPSKRPAYSLGKCIF